MADNSADLKFSDFSTSERIRIAGLVARMGTPRADIGKLRRKVERIENEALRRKKNGKK
ncbi:DUF6257 family protein [Streptomyces regalis]|uniref:DUF6257 family protein n=1 Tax=Streptomyces regalis TaxID=68262 RepID=UPI000AD003E7|nr:DUF6257 family protein [Streptomyces regalis]